MKKIVIVDGYNVIRRNTSLERSSLIAAREALAGAIAAFLVRRKIFDEAVIVFDGKGEAVSTERYAASQRIRIVFSDRKADADEVIRSLMRRSCGAARITAVSDDTSVTNGARALGADVLSTGEFVRMLGMSSAKKKIGSPVRYEEKAIDPRIRDDINEELKKIWL